MSQIKIVRKRGQVMKVEVVGHQGESCTQLTKALTQLGATEVELKPEYHEQPVQIQTDISLGGL
ncbi:DUF2997 domain-containing protein [Leptolyngbya sp. AN03gr2]|uniref:DUF2997 domain-containing protein n=1 Tax=unclassified Leptolyngbya TaxID=2650499 RepID=UPI003D313E16